MPKKITVTLEVEYVPLPPERRWAYEDAQRIIRGFYRKAYELWLADQEKTRAGQPQAAAEPPAAD